MKTTTKRVFSLFLALVMVLGLCTVGASATNPTITVYDANNNMVSGTYTTIDAAAAAAGANGRIVLGSGTYEFNGRQTIAVNGITLEGAGINSTIIITSSSYASGSTTNRKALLTIAATGVTVKDLTIDGGTYGANLVPTSSEETKFNVVRVNSGSATLQNVKIKNSKRTLLSVGTSTTSAAVVGQGLICDGTVKNINEANTYADVSIVYGSLTLDANCVIDAFINKDSNSNTKTLDISACDDLYTLSCPETFLFFTYYVETTSTVKHYMRSYEAGTTTALRDKFAKIFDYTGNHSVLNDMVEATIDSLEGDATDEELTIANQMLSALQYAKTQYPSNTTIEDWYDDLDYAISNAHS